MSISGSEHRLPAIGRGQDEWGGFAIIEPGEWRLNFGFVLVVEVEPEEDEPYGCRIALSRPHPDEVRQEHHELLQNDGIDPASINLLMPPAFCISVHLNHWGKVDGHRTLRPAPSDAPSTTH